MFMVVLALLLSLSVALPLAAQAEVYYPTTEWRTSTPEEQGMDSNALADLIESVPSLGHLDSLMIVRNGYVVAEVYWHPFASGLRHELQSASKSVLSALIGIAIDRGYIESVDQKVLGFFPEIEVNNLDDNKQAITIRDLLTMTSGLDCEITEGTTDPMYPLIVSPHSTQLGLDWPMADMPGSTWRYCQINAYLLSAILTRTTGMDTLAFAKQYLFAPLGITDADWNTSAEGLALGYCGLLLNTRDMAKIGYLFLNNGRWGDEQIVPADWVRESTQTYVEHPWGVDSAGYGYLWWTYDTPSGSFFEAQGKFFQHIHVSPDKNLVVADTGADLSLHISNIADPSFMEAILQAVTSDDPLSPNPAGVARLEAAVQAAADPEGQPSGALSSLVAEISGRTYRLEASNLLLPEADLMRLPEEDWQMATLGLDFGPDMATLRLQTESGIDLSVPVGLDGVYRVTTSHLGMLAARGEWANETRFVLDLRRVEQGPMVTYTLNFSDDGFTGIARLARPGDEGTPWSPTYITLEGQLMP
jgi:CubicO group peptidase (beta-lactamase class C family)